MKCFVEINFKTCRILIIYNNNFVVNIRTNTQYISINYMQKLNSFYVIITFKEKTECLEGSKHDLLLSCAVCATTAPLNSQRTFTCFSPPLWHDPPITCSNNCDIISCEIQKTNKHQAQRDIVQPLIQYNTYRQMYVFVYINL